MAYSVGKCLLLDLLKQKKMTQKDLADRLGVTKQQIQKYTSNERKMSLAVAKNVSKVLDCYIEDLYEWVNE